MASGQEVNGPMLTPAQAGQVLGVHAVTIISYIRDRGLPASKERHGFRQWYVIRPNDLVRFAQDNGLQYNGELLESG